jgi:hypothetical protein
MRTGQQIQTHRFSIVYKLGEKTRQKAKIPILKTGIHYDGRDFSDDLALATSSNWPG